MIDERSKAVGLPHHVVIDGRRRLTISGVEEVESFDENSVICSTSKGVLVVKGSELHIDKLSIEGGELNVEGTIDALEYEEPSKPGFWSRMFG